jgi:uncharacterized protein YydD (DUF2326 family)
MIKSIRSSSPTFKPVIFKKGFNVILADKMSESTDKDSRNGLGKTTLLGIIHFCLGANVKPNTGLRIEQLKDWTFFLDLTFGEKEFTISRNTTDFGRVYIEGDCSDWSISPEKDETNDGKLFLKISDWNLTLGQLMFGLPVNVHKKYAPTFRSLISYFIRHGHGAFEDPFKHHSQQLTWDIQVNNAYLLGLNWEYASDFQLLKDQKGLIDNLEKASKEGILSLYLGSQGELEAEKIRFEEQIKKSESQLKSFKVHPQYIDLQEKAATLTDEIHEITNKLIINQKLLKKYQETIVEENDVSVAQVKKIYSDAGLIFTDNLLTSLDNTIEFHKTIVTNRKAYLTSELDNLARYIEHEKQEIERLSDERAKLFQILKTHGALEEYTLLQKRVLDFKQQIDTIQSRIELIKKIDQGKSTLKIQREELLQKSRRDLDERVAQKKNAIQLFNQNSEYLYANPGILSIDVTDTGYKFGVDIQRSRSQGIGYMKIFCYDLMLIQNLALAKCTPKFLIHDSSIFDGVDDRQVAKAIELAYQESQNNDFQYICALNSDRIPNDDFSEGFRTKFDQSTRIVFTDATDSGGLLGMRF